MLVDAIEKDFSLREAETVMISAWLSCAGCRGCRSKSALAKEWQPKQHGMKDQHTLVSVLNKNIKKER
jgi:hypothetical protein